MNRRPYRSKVSLDKNWKPIDKWTLFVAACTGLALLITGLILRSTDVVLLGASAVVLIPVFGALYYWFVEGMNWLLEMLRPKRDDR